jgi:hypothetical protein
MPWWQAFSSAWGYYAANRDNLIPPGSHLAMCIPSLALHKPSWVARSRNHARLGSSGRDANPMLASWQHLFVPPSR